jgi:hypothetical protein
MDVVGFKKAALMGIGEGKRTAWVLHGVARLAPATGHTA